MALTSTCRPTCTKKMGMNRLARGPRSRSMRSACLVRPRARPATKAPMMGASSACMASCARAKVNTTAAIRTVPLPLALRWIHRNAGGATRWPTAVVTTRKANASRRTCTAPNASRDPSSTMRTTTVRITRPRTSSATAAPSTMRDSVLDRIRRSPKARAVMPTEVAVSAAPMNRAVVASLPNAAVAP